MLFAGAKLSHLAMMPQGRQERSKRARRMINALDEEFGPCSLYGECVEACPVSIPLVAVAGSTGSVGVPDSGEHAVRTTERLVAQ